MRYDLVEAPYCLPVTLDELKLYLGITFSDQDSLLLSFLKGATSFLENDLGTYLVKQTVKVTLFPDDLVRRGTKSIIKVNGRVSSIVSVTPEIPTSVEDDSILCLSLSVPPVDPIEVVYETGYGYREDVPEELKTLIKLLCAHWYENRNSVSESSANEVPMGINYMLNKYRTVKL